jgi:hypothetical protein
MAADVELYEDPAGLPYDGLVAAWHEVESRSAWFKARLAAAVPRGKLKQYAADVGAAYSTVAGYRSVAVAYAKVSDVRNIPFGAAEALLAQEDRFELVSRAEPWTVREARELVAERARAALPPAKRGPGRPRKPQQDHLSRNGTGGQQQENVSADHTTNGSSGGEDGKPVPEPAGQVQGSVQIGDTGTGAAPATAAEPDPEPCQRCAPQIAELERLLADRSAELETAHTRIRHLEQVRPDMLVLAERDALAEQNAALAERVAELEARLSAAPDGAEQEDPDAGPQTGPEAADWADGALPAPSGRRGRRQVCGNPRASKVRIVVEGHPVRVTMPGGREAGELWLCAEHIEQVTAGGADADPVDAGPDEDPFGFGEVSPCEYPAPAGVAA